MKMKNEMELNRVYNEDCLDTMAKMNDGVIDLVVTSPPYDNLRTYTGESEWNFDLFKKIANELYRIVKDGGVIVWVVSDATIKGSETGTSFKQALYFKEVGLRIHDTMIWEKANSGSIGSLNRYENVFEYMFVFSKGVPKKVNLIYDKPNKRYGDIQHGSIRQKDGTTLRTTNYGKKMYNKFGRRKNVWLINPVMSSKERCGHPAPFPVQLAYDHICSWSNEGDVVYDPFMGSGTTAVAAIRSLRSFIGSEISKEYCDIASKRIKEMQEIYDIF